FAALFSADGVSAGVSTSLIQSTAQAGAAFAVGSTTGVPASTLALAEGAIRVMTITKWATTILLIVAIGGLGAGFGLAPRTAFQEHPFAAPAQANVPTEQRAAKKKKVPAAQKTDKERIIGPWRLKPGQGNGEDVPAEVTSLMRLTFTKDGKLSI